MAHLRWVKWWFVCHPWNFSLIFFFSATKTSTIMAVVRFFLLSSLWDYMNTLFVKPKPKRFVFKLNILNLSSSAYTCICGCFFFIPSLLLLLSSIFISFRIYVCCVGYWYEKCCRMFLFGCFRLIWLLCIVVFRLHLRTLFLFFFVPLIYIFILVFFYPYLRVCFKWKFLEKKRFRRKLETKIFSYVKLWICPFLFL